MNAVIIVKIQPRPLADINRSFLDVAAQSAIFYLLSDDADPFE
jgi:hypothetical protein